MGYVKFKEVMDFEKKLTITQADRIRRCHLYKQLAPNDNKVGNYSKWLYETSSDTIPNDVEKIRNERLERL